MNETPVYIVIVEGRLSEDWALWFEGVQVCYEATSGCSQLRLAGDDPGLLYGVLAQIGALNLKLVAVERKP